MARPEACDPGEEAPGAQQLLQVGAVGRPRKVKPRVGGKSASGAAQGPEGAVGARELHRLKRAVYRAGKPRDIAMFEVLSNAGLRRGRAVRPAGRGCVPLGAEGKSDGSQRQGNKYREVPLNIETRKSLSAAYLSTRPGADPDDPLLVGQRGAMTPSGVWRALQSYAREAGVAVSPHVLRHTFATRLLRKAGTDLVTVKEAARPRET